MKINSSAVTEITASYGEPILITFKSGKTYAYKYNSVFVNKLQETLDAGESVGRLVNRSLRSDELVPVA